MGKVLAIPLCYMLRIDLFQAKIKVTTDGLSDRGEHHYIHMRNQHAGGWKGKGKQLAGAPVCNEEEGFVCDTKALYKPTLLLEKQVLIY